MGGLVHHLLGVAVLRAAVGLSAVVAATIAASAISTRKTLDGAMVGRPAGLDLQSDSSTGEKGTKEGE